MTADQFRSEVLPEIYKRYSYKDGLVCVCKTKEGLSPYQICIPTKDNPDSPWNPTKCFMWNRGKLLYEGELNNGALVSRYCRKYKTCHIVFTTVSRMETSKDGVRMCVCSPEQMGACKKKCPFKADPKAILPVKIYD